MRNFPAAAATGLTLLASGWAHAIGLGGVVGQSAIGEPLRIEITLIAGASADSSCIRLSPGSGADLPWVRQARIALTGTGQNRRIIVSSSQPVYDPIVMLGLELSCEGMLRREYPLLLPSAIARPQAQPESRPARTAPSEHPAMAESAPARDAAPTLNELAQRLYPGDRNLRRRFVAAARRAHPDQFPNRASTSRPMADEAALDIAALRRQAETPPAATRAPRATAAPSTPRAESAPKASTAAPVASTEAAATPPASAPTPGAMGGDRLTVIGDAPPPDLKLSFSLSDPGLVGRTSDDERERMRQEQRLLLALDEKIIAQLEIASKIRELEQYQRHLTSEAGKLGIGAAQADQAVANETGGLETQRPPAPPQGPVAAEADSAASSWWQFLLAIAGFALVASLLALYLRRKRLDREREEADFFATGDSEEPGAPEIQAEPGMAAAKAHTAAAADSGHEALGEPMSSMDFAPLDWEPPNSLPPEETVAPLPLAEEDLAGEHDSAVELAEIMMSFGRVQGAAQTLADFIRGNPKQAVVPWLKLLEVYKTADMRAEFDGLTQQLNRTFNVKVVEWDDFDMEKASSETIERMPHIIAELERLWGTVECQAYLHKLLRDNRDGTRQGFPLAVIDDILCLLGILNQHLGAYREATPDAGNPVST